MESTVIGNSMNYSIITYIFNGYEKVHEVKQVQNNVEYILVTDDKTLTSNTWQIKYEPLLDTDKITGIAKTFLVKYNADKYVSNDIYMVIDSQITLINSVDNIINYFIKKNADIMTFQHCFNENFYDEYDTWEIYRNHNTKWREFFFKTTKNLGYDYSWRGLLGTTLSVRRKTNAMTNFFSDMINYLFPEGYKECDNNDQCYYTILLMTKYDKIIKTEIISWTLLYSNYLYMCHHGTLEINDYLKNYFDIDEIIYWRGKPLKQVEKFPKCYLLK